MDFTLAPVTIQQIVVFLRVVECRGFAKASGYLHMTQSAVSKSVAKLEKELGILLFQRTTREIHLTEAGSILYEEWKEQIKAMHNSYIKAISLQEEMDSVLHVGFLNTARPERYLWGIEERFKKKYPDIRLELESEYMTDLEEKLISGHYDAIMVPCFERYTVEACGLEWKWAACSNAYVLMSENHPLAHRSTLKTSDILYENFVYLENSENKNHLRDLEERFMPYHVKPNALQSYKNAYEIKYLFRTGERTLVVTDDYFDYPDTPGIVRIPLTDQMNGIICAWNPNNQKSQLKKFVHMVAASDEV